jgi:hypothetical protein
MLIGLLAALVLALGTRLGITLQARGDQAPKATRQAALSNWTSEASEGS